MNWLNYDLFMLRSDLKAEYSHRKSVISLEKFMQWIHNYTRQTPIDKIDLKITLDVRKTKLISKKTLTNPIFLSC